MSRRWKRRAAPPPERLPRQLMGRLFFASPGEGDSISTELTYVGEPSVDRTVAHLNVEHYRRLLATETDESKRTTLKRLHAEEEAKLASIQQKNADAGSVRSNGRGD